MAASANRSRATSDTSMTDAPVARAAYDDSMNVDTPDYTDSEDPNTTASSVVDGPADGRKRRSEATQLRKSVFGKKHGALMDTKVGSLCCQAILRLPVMHVCRARTSMTPLTDIPFAHLKLSPLPPRLRQPPQQFPQAQYATRKGNEGANAPAGR